MIDDTEVQLDKRAELARGLRGFADFIEAHEEIPFAPHLDFEMSLMIYVNEDEVRAVAQGSGGWEKEYEENFMHLSRDFGPVSLDVFCHRKGVCEPKSTKTEIVEEPDREWLQAEIAKLKEVQPTRTVEKVTVLEWDCKPLLGKGSDV